MSVRRLLGVFGRVNGTRSAKSKAEDREKLEWVNLGMNRDIELVKAHVALAQELRHSEE